MINAATERHLRMVVIWWYLLGWIPCLRLNALGVRAAACIGLYVSMGFIAYVVGTSIARHRADHFETEADPDEAA